MPVSLRDLDPTPQARAALDEHGGGWCWLGAPESPESFEDYEARVLSEASQRHRVSREDLREPSDPRLLNIKGWHYAFAEGGYSYPQEMFGDVVFVALQDYPRGFVAAADWRLILDGAGADAWLARGVGHEEEGELIRANAAFAAARWLDPALQDEIAPILARRPNAVFPDRFLQQPRLDVLRKRFGQRHWEAWAMKSPARLEVPSLLGLESDENFSIRTRVYRALGQVAAVSAIPCLHEATRDPHFFARAQAARSLGWLCDPTGRRREIDAGRTEPRRCCLPGSRRRRRGACSVTGLRREHRLRLRRPRAPCGCCP